MGFSRTVLWVALAWTCGQTAAMAEETPATQGTKAPFSYVPATAYHILPETTSEESGYFSLNEGIDGKIYVGTAKYGVNAFLVEFDPATSAQRIVLDTNKVTGATGVGYAAQAKLHTRNFTGPSGKIYVGSKQGYRQNKEDKSEYPGGYAMIYDPKTDTSESLGMPFPTQGVIDTVADESRGLLYVVTCEDQHWMLGNLKTRVFRELGPMLTPYATTLVDSRGVASSITKDFQLAQYDPASDKVTTRPIQVDGELWTRASNGSIPTWYLAPDGRTAYLILMNDPTLITIDLHSTGQTVEAKSHGKLIDGKSPDSRSSMVVDQHGVVWAIVRVANTTGFGKGMLHHLTRYDPARGQAEDLGVVVVTNPDYVEWPTPGKHGGMPFSHHGFHRLPDGTLTILHAHMGLIAAHDGTLYMTALYPYTLLKIEGFKTAVPAKSAGDQYLHDVLTKLDAVEKQIPKMAAIAETVADRYIKGGNIVMPWLGGTLEQELSGRAGGMLAVPSKATGQNDIAIATWDTAPRPSDFKKVSKLKAAGAYIIGFGPRNLSSLSECAALTDAWFDTGEETVGHTHHVINAALGWTFTAELVAALTRRGEMPVMQRSWALEDGKAWAEQNASEKRLHKNLKVEPIAPGTLSLQYLTRARDGVRRLQTAQLPGLLKYADAIAKEFQAGRQTIVAYNGHMGMNYVGRYEDKTWAIPHELHEAAEGQMKGFEKRPDGALVLRLGSNGLHQSVADLLTRKQERVLLITSENPRPEWAVPAKYSPWVDLGVPVGDACINVPGYPIPILPLSGILQTAAYECVNVEAQAKLK